MSPQTKEEEDEWKVVKFKSIPNPKFPFIPNSLMDDLSSDQYYADRICSAVMLGLVNANLEFLKIGGLNHSRWLTLGCRNSSILCCPRKADI